METDVIAPVRYVLPLPPAVSNHLMKTPFPFVIGELICLNPKRGSQRGDGQKKTSVTASDSPARV